MTDAQVSLGERLGPVSVEGSALADQIFGIVGNAIVEGMLQPGEKVNDKELAAALGISRTPVREALQRLTWVGLVEVAPSRYTRVTEITDRMVASTLEYTGMQASVALQLAMRHMNAEELAEAVTILDRVIAATEVDDAEGMMNESLSLLGYLVRKSANPIFVAMMAETSLLVTRNLRHLRPERGSAPHRVECFREMRTAMLAGDADSAEKWFRRQHGIGVDVSL